MRYAPALMLVMVIGGAARAELRLPHVIGSYMVLQRDQPAPIWGWADAGAAVTVRFADQSRSATAGADGRWRVTLDAMPASAEPRTLSVTAGDDRVELAEVLVGEVWVCSGQSNMAWMLSRADGGAEAAKAADHPSIRLLLLPQVARAEPADDIDAKWKPCTPESAERFSAVGYFFGARLHEELGIPVGLIGSYWGGTRAEAWTPRDALDAVPDLAPMMDHWRQHVAKGEPDAVGAGKGEAVELSRRRPGNLYNGMIAPMVPFAVRGVIWYQGEANVTRAHQYRTLLPTLIASWRSAWDQPVNRSFPFLIVQLAPHRYGGDRGNPELLPELWEAQLHTLRTVPDTGLAVITDVSSIGNIHPKNKRPVGERLARWALAKTYGRDVVHSGPLFAKAEFDGARAIVHFDAATAVGLTSRDAKPLTHFELAGSDGVWHAAAAGIEGETVVVTAAAVPAPAAVRFAWRQDAVANLTNAAGLPASSFRSNADTWHTRDKHH